MNKKISEGFQEMLPKKHSSSKGDTVINKIISMLIALVVKSCEHAFNHVSLTKNGSDYTITFESDGIKYETQWCNFGWVEVMAEGTYAGDLLCYDVAMSSCESNGNIPILQKTYINDGNFSSIIQFMINCAEERSLLNDIVKTFNGIAGCEATMTEMGVIDASIDGKKMLVNTDVFERPNVESKCDSIHYTLIIEEESITHNGTIFLDSDNSIDEYVCRLVDNIRFNRTIKSIA